MVRVLLAESQRNSIQRPAPLATWHRREPLHARVEKGRLVFNEPTTPPEGTVLETVADDEGTISVRVSAAPCMTRFRSPGVARKTGQRRLIHSFRSLRNASRLSGTRRTSVAHTDSRPFPACVGSCSSGLGITSITSRARKTCGCSLSVMLNVKWVHPSEHRPTVNSMPGSTLRQESAHLFERPSTTAAACRLERVACDRHVVAVPRLIRK